jgi:hypothetical protein
LVFTRERYRWTEPELNIIEANAHLSLERIQKKLAFVSPHGVKRTRVAIAGQIHQQRFRTNLDGLEHAPLADALGISVSRLHQLRDRDLIKGERLESIAQACGYREAVLDVHRHWFYHDDDIVRLLFAARGELDLRKVNQTWLMGLLEPYITLFQIAPKQARLAERERTKLAHRRRKRQLPKRKRPSTNTRPSKLGVLAEPVVDAIQAGRPVLTRRGRFTGVPASLPAATVTGSESKRNGGEGVKRNGASADRS